MFKNVFDPFLVSLGWNEFFQTSFSEDAVPGSFPGRVISQGKGHYHVHAGKQAILEAAITSGLRNSATTAIDLPGVGDWVVLTGEQGTAKANIHRVLPRKSVLQRKRVGTAHETQLIVTNTEFVFIVTSLNEDFDLQRLGRYLALCKDSGAKPIFLLTKTDLCENPEHFIQQLRKDFGDVEIFMISKNNVASMDQLKTFFAPGLTAVLLGSSGVGKSTLTNYLVGGELQKTRDLSGEAKGRHTTTSRNLFVTRWGGLVIDTPGMQEISKLHSTDETNKKFPDIEELMLRCKFTNCRHGNDPGCAISAGLKSGTLLQERWNDYIRLGTKK
jgi:ribosome biogenesis GTPase / thiamine phosphate phosphatase